MPREIVLTGRLILIISLLLIAASFSTLVFSTIRSLDSFWVGAIQVILVSLNTILVWASLNAVQFVIIQPVIERRKLENGEVLVIIPSFIMEKSSTPFKAPRLVKIIVYTSHHIEFLGVTFRGKVVKHSKIDDTTFLIEINKEINRDTEVNIEVILRKEYRNQPIHTKPHITIEVYEKLPLVPIQYKTTLIAETA